MTTILGNEDPFEEVERGIDWLERLENIRGATGPGCGDFGDRELCEQAARGYCCSIR